MEDPAPAIPLEKLVAHREWVRRVARALVRDESLADDLEQEVWLEALQRPPRSEGSLGAWLSTALRHNLVDLRRSESRRRVREEGVARQEAVKSVAELVVEAESHKQVVAAVLGLEEPYRGTILLRYFENLPLKEVARRQGVPLETVRTRIRKAIELLRDRLDSEKNGDRKAWCLALLPLFENPETSVPAGAGTGAAVTGGLLMAGKVVAGAAIVAVGALLIWAFWPGPSSSLGGGRAVSPEFTRQEARPPLLPEKPAPPRVRAASGAPSVVVLDPAGKPVGGAEVSFLPRGGTSEEDVAVAVGTTDSLGRATLSVTEWKLPGMVRARCPEFAPGEAFVASGMEAVTIRLGRPCTLRGTVVTADDSPVADACVELRAITQLHALGTILGTGGIQRYEVRSDPTGAFVFGGLPRVQYGVLTARAEGYADSQSMWTASRGQPVRLVLDRPFRAVVRLRDPNGTPLPNGKVGAFSGKERIRLTENALTEPEWVPFQSQGDGTYVCTTLPPGWYTCLAAHPGCRPKTETVAFSPRTRESDLTLDGVAGISGRVIDARSGSSLQGARVLAVPPPAGGSTRVTDSYANRSISELVGPPLEAVAGAGGEFRLTVAVPGDDLLLIITMPGYMAAARRLQDLGTKEPYEIPLEPMERLVVAGRVVNQAGEPVPHAFLRWSDGSNTAGADGQFRIESVGKADVLAVMAEDFFPRIVPLAEQSGGDLGDIQLVPMRRVEGKVVDARGRPIAGLFLLAKPVDSSHSTPGAAGAGVGRSDEQGQVVLPLVRDITYRVVAFQEKAFPGEVLVAADAEGPFTLVVSMEVSSRTGTIRGRLELEDGSWAPVRAVVLLMDGKKPVPLVAPSEVRPDGRFEIDMVPEGIWALRVGMADRVRGELPGVAVPEGGEVGVVIPCATVPDAGAPPPPPRADVRVQPLPGEDPNGPRTLRAWLTTEGKQPSLPLRPAAESLYLGSLAIGRRAAVWVYDWNGTRAGVVAEVIGGQEGLVQVTLEPAGRVVVQKRDDWFSLEIDVQDAAGKRVFSNRAIELPWAKDEGTVLLLPAGAYEVSVSAGGEGQTARTERVVVSPGKTVLVK